MEKKVNKIKIQSDIYLCLKLNFISIFIPDKQMGQYNKFDNERLV